MEKLTYKQAFDKIIEAYFKDEIEPCSPTFCFCGNLCDNQRSWVNGNGLYTDKEYGKMEAALFSPFPVTQVRTGSLIHNDDGKYIYHIKEMNNYEDLLFDGMTAALEVLKQIHKERGEDVDDMPEFTKRKLQTV